MSMRQREGMYELCFCTVTVMMNQAPVAIVRHLAKCMQTLVFAAWASASKRLLSGRMKSMQLSHTHDGIATGNRRRKRAIAALR